MSHIKPEMVRLHTLQIMMAYDLDQYIMPYLHILEHLKTFLILCSIGLYFLTIIQFAFGLMDVQWLMPLYISIMLLLFCFIHKIYSLILIDYLDRQLC